MTGFQSPADMVSKWWMRPHACFYRKAGINRKFTPNPIARIFREFSLI
jgi:hypothetical protein